MTCQGPEIRGPDSRESAGFEPDQFCIGEKVCWCTE